MKNTRIILEGTLFSIVAALLQLIPFLFSEMFVLFTIFSAFPIFLVTRKNKSIGMLSYLTAAFLIFIISTHEAIFFIFTNGIIGFSLGIFENTTKYKFLGILFSGINLFISICIINFIIGINVFRFKVDVKAITISLILLFSIIYSFLFYCLIYFLMKIKYFKKMINKK